MNRARLQQNESCTHSEVYIAVAEREKEKVKVSGDDLFL